MNGVRPLVLTLAVATGCVALAIMSPGLAGWKAFLPAGVAESATPQQSCVDDLSVQNLSIYDRGNGYVFQDPPDYANGDDIVIFYDVVNASCREVTVTVVLTGSVSGATIHDADGSSAPCLDGCTIAAGATQQSNAQWDLSKHPNATGEKVVATVTIDAPSDFSDADTSNNSATSTDAINIVNEVSTVDVAVKSATASKTAALIGDDIDFTVTIRNNGDAEADATVTLDLGEDTDELDSTMVSDLAADGESMVTLSWDTDDAEAGEHDLRVLAEAEGDSNSANDSKTVRVTLREPSIDIAVTALKASPAEAIIGETVDFTVSLENDGDVAIAPAVSLYKGDDTEALGSATAATIVVRGTGTVSISWDTDDAEAGTYSLRAVATVADDDDSTNDSATASLTLHDPVEVALSLTSPVASSAVNGNSVTVPFTVTNSGENDTVEVLVSLYVTEAGQDQEEEATATANVSTLAVNESTSDTLTWDTADANVGHYEILLVATTAGDTDQRNNSVSASIEIRNWLVLQSVTPERVVAVVGEAVELAARVANVGQEELTNLTVGLFEPNVTGTLGSTTIASIAAGSTADATFEWDTDGREVEVLGLIVSAGVDGQDPDGDDSQRVNIDLRNPIALSSAVLASTDNVAGSSVTVNVQVLNESDAEVTDVAVGLYVGDSEEASETATIESIPAGETVGTSVTWDAGDDGPGEYQLKVVAGSAEYNADSNDEALLDVTLRAPVMAVALTAATVNRDVAAIGQTLEVAASITNHGEAAVAVPVGLYLVGDLQQTTVASTGTSSRIEPGSSSEVGLQWDSTGESVGTHTLKIAAELPEDTTTADNEHFLEIELFRSAFDGAEDVDGCVEDVRIKVTDIRDFSGQKRSPPNYLVGEQLKAAYRIYNFSCQTDITLAITMSGPGDHAVNDTEALCFSNCVVPFGGKSEGEIAWTIPTLPALSDQPINAAVTIVRPEDFVDIDVSNNSNASTDRMNIVHPEDLVVRLGEQNDEEVSPRQSLSGPEFGAVDVRLVSVQPLQTTLGFAAETVEIAVEVANDGPTTEPASVRFALIPTDGTEPQELYRHTMVIRAGETKTASLEVPVTGVLPGAHTVEVLLSAAIDQSPENNTATVEITRMGPMVEVEMLDVSVSPEVLMLGDDVTVSLAIHNKSEVALFINLELYVDDELEPTVTKNLDELASDGQAEEQVAWRVPASAKMLGQHILKLVAFSEDFGPIAVVNSEITVHIDAEIVSIDALPAETAMQGEEVAVEVEVRNNGLASVNVPVTLHFPSATKNPETRSPSVPAESTETVRFAWKTRDYAVGEHMLTATVPEQHNVAGGETSMELPFRVSPLVVAATIVDVSVYPTAPMVGEPVSIAVRVRNDGPVATRIPIALHFPPGSRQPDSRKPRLDPGETGTVVFEWLTGNFRPGTHRFSIEVAAVDTPQQRFTVELLPTVENVALVGMGTYPVETAMVGEPVEVWIDVRNDGPVALNVPVRLTFPSASKRPEVRSPRVAPGETARVWFEWKTSNYEPGIYTLRAAIRLGGNITFGRTAEEIRFALTPLIIDATIVDVAVNPEEPRVGEPVTIAVTVRNDGRIAANIPVTLHFPSSDKQPETRRPRVDPGATGEVSFAWRTSHYEPGVHAFVVEVASTPPATREFTVELLPPIVDVAIVGMGSDPSEMAVQGQEVKVWIDVINNGPSARSVPLQLSFPAGDKQPERKSPRIEPGEIARIEFTWKTSNYDPGIHTLTATVLAEYNITELDTSATIQIRLISAQLIASIVGISWSPDSPVVGEPVRITVTVRNDGLVAANIPVTLHFPSGDKQPETRRPRVAPGAVGTASFTWRTSRYEPGDHLFRVQIPGVAGAVRTFEIGLRPAEVDFAVVNIQAPDPLRPIVKGDWVEITALVQNQGPYAGRGTVYLLDSANLDTMYEHGASLEPGEFREVEFTWKTLRYPVGGYELLARVDAEYDTDPDNDESDRVHVHLLTNRDITVGFGNDHRPVVFAEPASEADLSAIARYRNDILVVGKRQTPIDRPVAPASGPPMDVSPNPTGGNYDPARMYWRWRSAQLSPWECARYQREIGESLPRAVVCSKAPALVR